ncbi:MAG: HK97 family phage prohead protease, partial [Pseudomonadota bacterium]
AALSHLPIAGYAAIFNVPDKAGDVIRPGAFRKTLCKVQKLIPATAPYVRMLYQHAADRPVGCWREIREDSDGLFVRGYLLTETQDGRDLAALLQGGALDGLFYRI